jgi:hypothetical protein
MPLHQEFHYEPIFNMIREDQVFVANVIITDLIREMMVTNVTNRPIGAPMELIAIAKIHKYKRLHDGCHFISMVMEVHDTHGCDMDHFIKECACFSP